ncbi:uncharacterized protein O9250_013703 [Rhynochetos jubatus]
MAFASLLEHVGGMGRFQVVSVLLLALPVLMMASHNLLQNFTAAASDHRCRLRWEVNGTGVDPGDDLLRVSVPPGERCRRFVTPQWWLLEVNGTLPNGSWPETEPCRDGWAHDRSVFTSTIVTEWDLVCSSRGLRELAQSLYMAGVLVGGIVFGGLSDRFGRRSLLTWCYLQMGAMGTCSSFAPTFPVYCLFRFGTGMAFSGIVLNSVSLSLEWMPTRTRALVGTFMGYCYTAGQFLLAGVAYGVPDWRRLQFAVSLPFFGFFLYSWWLTESARWLVMVGKSHQALRELRKVARINGKKEEGDKLDIEVLKSYMQKEMTSSRSRHTAVDLVRTPVVRRISCCLCFVWFSTSFAYYGLAMDLQNFDFNIYVIQLVFGAVDIPAKLLSILTITFVGRRFTQAVALVLAGLAILANTLVPRDLRTLRTALAVFGKGCLAASFNCVFLYTGELYPTVIRQTGMGLANTMARLGSITAPLVKMAGEAFPTLPFVIYGAAPVVSGLVAVFLPETRDAALPETVEEVEGRTQKDEAQHLQIPLQPTQPSGTTGPRRAGVGLGGYNPPHPKRRPKGQRRPQPPPCMAKGTWVSSSTQAREGESCSRAQGASGDPTDPGTQVPRDPKDPEISRTQVSGNPGIPRIQGSQRPRDPEDPGIHVPGCPKDPEIPRTQVSRCPGIPRIQGSQRPRCPKDLGILKTQRSRCPDVPRPHGSQRPRCPGAQGSQEYRDPKDPGVPRPQGSQGPRCLGTQGSQEYRDPKDPGMEVPRDPKNPGIHVPGCPKDPGIPKTQVSQGSRDLKNPGVRVPRDPKDPEILRSQVSVYPGIQRTQGSMCLDVPRTQRSQEPRCPGAQGSQGPRDPEEPGVCVPRDPKDPGITVPRHPKDPGIQVPTQGSQESRHRSAQTSQGPTDPKDLSARPPSTHRNLQPPSRRGPRRPAPQATPKVPWSLSLPAYAPLPPAALLPGVQGAPRDPVQGPWRLCSMNHPPWGGENKLAGWLGEEGVVPIYLESGASSSRMGWPKGAVGHPWLGSGTTGTSISAWRPSPLTHGRIWSHRSQTLTGTRGRGELPADGSGERDSVPGEFGRYLGRRRDRSPDRSLDRWLDRVASSKTSDRRLINELVIDPFTGDTRTTSRIKDKRDLEINNRSIGKELAGLIDREADRSIDREGEINRLIAPPSVCPLVHPSPLVLPPPRLRPLVTPWSTLGHSFGQPFGHPLVAPGHPLANLLATPLPTPWPTLGQAFGHPLANSMVTPWSTLGHSFGHPLPPHGQLFGQPLSHPLANSLANPLATPWPTSSPPTSSCPGPSPSSIPHPTMTFVELLARLGGMGRFQVTYVAALAIPLLMLASHNLLQNFTAGIPEHHCRPRPAANGSAGDVPLLVSVPSDGRRRPHPCRRYVEPQWHLLEVNDTANGTANGLANGAATEPCRDGWTYHDGVFAHTIVSEWDLVCESKRLRQVAQSVYMAGILLGSGLFGVLSDKFGRRALLTWCYLQLGVTGAGTAAAPTFAVYCLCRFLSGLAMAGVSLNSASLCMEWIPTEARAVVGTINGYCYTVGQFVLAGVAFALPRWRWLQLAVSLPFFLFFLYSWFFVESARWQVISGRPDLALKGLRKVARVNGRKEEGDKLSEEALRELVHREAPLPGGALAALVRTPGMRTVSCGVSFVWFSTSFAYYGLAMDLQGFGVDVYLSQLVFGAVDIPAKLASVLAITCLGRRVAQGGSLALAGACILANILVPTELQMLRMAFAVIGKGSLAASFNCAYIFSGELFPTVIRQTGMGLGGTMARVGSMVAPLVRMAADVTPVLPLVIYGAAPIVSAIATCFLPETRQAALPETVQDVERRAGHLKAEEVTVPLSSTETKDGV